MFVSPFDLFFFLVFLFSLFPFVFLRFLFLLTSFCSVNGGVTKVHLYTNGPQFPGQDPTPQPSARFSCVGLVVVVVVVVLLLWLLLTS